ncbi:hypothetical protein SESBI_34543 [Sesbania bispinosa]|nr:hypothetical protein SESBI_34543 [Sesbania bispinosa]
MDSDEDEKAGANLGNDAAFNLDGCRGHALNHGSHCCHCKPSSGHFAALIVRGY